MTRNDYYNESGNCYHECGNYYPIFILFFHSITIYKLIDLYYKAFIKKRVNLNLLNDLL